MKSAVSLQHTISEVDIEADLTTQRLKSNNEKPDLSGSTWEIAPGINGLATK